MQTWIDMTPGTPRFYRTVAVSKAYQYLGAERLLWGTDGGVAGYNPRHVIEMDEKVLNKELKMPAEEQEKIYHYNVEQWIGARLPK